MNFKEYFKESKINPDVELMSGVYEHDLYKAKLYFGLDPKSDEFYKKIQSFFYNFNTKNWLQDDEALHYEFYCNIHIPKYIQLKEHPNIYFSMEMTGHYGRHKTYVVNILADKEKDNTYKLKKITLNNPEEVASQENITYNFYADPDLEKYVVGDTGYLFDKEGNHKVIETPKLTDTQMRVILITDFEYNKKMAHALFKYHFDKILRVFNETHI
jgi:hypothetical protein